MRQLSLFSQSLDRGLFVTYFLGGVVPLLALLGVVQQYALPAFEGDRQAQLLLIGLVSASGLLSLGSFFALRRIAKGALSRIEANRSRLERMLRASRELAAAPHARVVLETAAECAASLCDARAALVFLRGNDQRGNDQRGDAKELSLQGSVGRDVEALHAERQEDIEEWIEAACQDGRRLEAMDGRLHAAVLPAHGGDQRRLVLVVLRDAAQGAFEAASLDATATLLAQTAAALESAELRDAQRNFFAHMTDMVVTALDTHVEGREGHASAVARLANRVGRELGLDEDALQHLHFAALLHDVGMLKIRREHHGNPQAFRKHPVLGHRMLSRITLWEPVAPMVLQHHEWFDGSGYPEGLAEVRIHPGARILAVCDAYQAMRADDWNGPMAQGEIVEELVRLRGTQFDPGVVDAVLRLRERGELEV